MITTGKATIWKARAWLFGATTLLILIGLSSQAAAMESCGEGLHSFAGGAYSSGAFSGEVFSELGEASRREWSEFSPLDLMSLEPFSPGRPSIAQASIGYGASGQTPCSWGGEGRSVELGNYDLCFVETPWPMTTMPKWIAQWQAEEAVSQVFRSINEIHDGLDQRRNRLRERAPLRYVPERVWLSEIVARMEQGSLPAEGRKVCIETSDQSCQSPPTRAQGTSISMIAPASRAEPEPEGASKGSKILTELGLPDAPGVGPSQEHRPQPERPPPA